MDGSSNDRGGYTGDHRSLFAQRGKQVNMENRSTFTACRGFCSSLYAGRLWIDWVA